MWVPQEPHSQHKWMLQKVVTSERAKSFRVICSFQIWARTQQGEINHWCKTQCNFFHHQGEAKSARRSIGMWASLPLTNLVEGPSLCFIIDSGSQKKLISVQFVKRLVLLTTLHHNHTPSCGSTKGKITTSINGATFPTTSSLSQMRYCVMLIPLNFVMFYLENNTCGSIMLCMSPKLVL